MSLRIKHFYQFGEFTIDAEQKVLLRQGKPLPLTPKAFDTLLILVEKSGQIAEKDELMNRLWPETFVEEANLTFNIQQLRKSLGDNARNPLYIETVARRGRKRQFGLINRDSVRQNFPSRPALVCVKFI